MHLLSQLESKTDGRSYRVGTQFETRVGIVNQQLVSVRPLEVVHGPDQFSVPNLRTKPRCYQLILLHKLLSNLYDNLSE